MLTKNSIFVHSKITKDQYLSLEKKAKRAYYFTMLVKRGSRVAAFGVHLILSLVGYFRLGNSLTLLIWHLFWCFVIYVWLGYLTLAFAGIPSLCYLAAEYLKMRYTILCSNVRDLRLRPAGDAIGGQLDVVLYEQNELMHTVFKYNLLMKWILGAINFICSPIASICIYTAIYMPFDVPALQPCMIFVSLEVIAVILLFASVAGDVNSLAKRSYGDINAIQIRHSKTLEIGTKKQVSNTLIKMIIIIGRGNFFHHFMHRLYSY